MIQYDSFMLDNGLRVLVHQDPSSPRATLDVVYKVGARDERPERTGLAHLFEHLMFGGSRHIPNFDSHIQRAGGENNAFTTNDLTNYYITLPANQLETAFWLESDRMLQLDFSQRSLDVQKSVVMEEFKQRYLNQPYGDAYLLLRPLHYAVHPYRWMTIGKELAHIEVVTLPEIEEFFYSFYAPNNATLVVAGDVQLEAVKRLAEKWFGPIPHREVKRPERPAEPAQTAARTLTVQRPVPAAMVYKAYHVPARLTDEFYATDLLTDVLSSGKASRLYRALVKERQVANQVSAFSWGLHDASMLSINAQLATGVSTAQYEAALAEVLAGVVDLDDAELQRVKNKVESSSAFERTEVQNRAMGLALCDALGDVDLINTEVARYQAVRVGDVLRAHHDYLRPENCSTLYYLPEN